MVIEQAHHRAVSDGNSIRPRLENGDHLTATEFLRRYEAMPEVRKAELVGGIVYMASPIRVDQHAEPDALVQTWLGNYCAGTPGTKHAANGTVRLSSDDVLQPDAFMRIVPESGGKTRVDAQGYLFGPPELAVEIAASSVSIDTREKLGSYRRAGVREYIVWRTQEGSLDWWYLDEDQYQLIPAANDGTLKSRVFPGLWLNVRSLLDGNGAAVLLRVQEGLSSPEHKSFVESLQRFPKN